MPDPSFQSCSVPDKLLTSIITQGADADIDDDDDDDDDDNVDNDDNTDGLDEVTSDGEERAVELGFAFFAGSERFLRRMSS